MSALLSYTCSRCGQTHSGSPSFGFDEPWHHAALEPQQRAAQSRINADFCIISGPDGRTDRFVRTVLELPIHGVDQPLTWGVWVSLSENSFEHYSQTFDAPAPGTSYFGWFSNRLPGYPETLAVPADVAVRAAGLRPLLTLHRQHQHPLVNDQHRGLSAERAREIDEILRHGA